MLVSYTRHMDVSLMDVSLQEYMLKHRYSRVIMEV